ncbi:unnamed protein product, partial [Discosporangium mesarthrocarpum]
MCHFDSAIHFGRGWSDGKADFCVLQTPVYRHEKKIVNPSALCATLLSRLFVRPPLGFGLCVLSRFVSLPFAFSLSTWYGLTDELAAGVPWAVVFLSGFFLVTSSHFFVAHP